MISIVIPYYNHESELSKALASIARQEHVNYEVIVVDDGSTVPLDAALVREYIPTAQIVRHDRNMGAPAARNTGLDLASGTYIIFWDADVVAKPTMLEQMQEVLDTRPEIDVVYSDFIFGPKLFHLHPFDRVALEKKNYIHSTSLVRMSSAVRWDESLKKLQDWDYWLTLSKQGSVGYWIDAVLYSVGERTSGMSRWIPSFAYRAPFRWLPFVRKQVQAYDVAASIVREKHGM